MSVTNLTVMEKGLIESLKKDYEQTKHTSIKYFNSDVLRELIWMQDATNDLFNYTNQGDYLEALLHTLRCSLFGSNYQIEEQSAERSRTGDESETVTINRDDAGDMFFLISLIAKYLSDMSRYCERAQFYGNPRE